MEWIRSIPIVGATFFAAFTLGAPLSACAEAYEFVRVTCVPENRYLEIEYKTLEQEIVEEGPGNRSGLAKHGYLDPHLFSYQCKLGSAVYVVSSHQDQPRASGTCGGAPGISLTVRRDRAVLVDGVLFGNTCNGDASLTRLWFNEGESDGVPPEMSLCIAPRVLNFAAPKPEEVCPLLGRGEVSKATPITADRIAPCRTRAVEYTCLFPNEPTRK